MATVGRPRRGAGRRWWVDRRERRENPRIPAQCREALANYLTRTGATRTPVLDGHDGHDDDEAVYACRAGRECYGVRFGSIWMVALQSS